MHGNVDDLVVNERPYRPSKYLVCVDDSDVSRLALRYAAMKARKRALMIDLLHVVPPAEVQSIGDLKEKVEAEMREKAEKLLQELGEEVQKLTGTTPSLLIREGKVGDEIIAQAMEEYDVNMLVLGAAPEGAGRGKLIPWLASKLGDSLLVPLMLVPGNLTDQQMDDLS